MTRANRRRLRSDHIGKSRRPHLDERGRPWSNRLFSIRDRLFLNSGQLDIDEIETKRAEAHGRRRRRQAEELRIDVGVRGISAEFAGLIGQEAELRHRYEVLVACIMELEELQDELECSDPANGRIVGDRIKDLQFERTDVEVNLMRIGIVV